jgi:hypothetical protein
LRAVYSLLFIFALCALRFALCSLIFALCSLLFCDLLFDLCFLLFVLCSFFDLCSSFDLCSLLFARCCLMFAVCAAAWLGPFGCFCLVRSVTSTWVAPLHRLRRWPFRDSPGKGKTKVVPNGGSQRWFHFLPRRRVCYDKLRLSTASTV